MKRKLKGTPKVTVTSFILFRPFHIILTTRSLFLDPFSRVSRLVGLVPMPMSTWKAKGSKMKKYLTRGE